MHGETVFIPDLIPRRGVIAFWGTGSGSDKVELVFAGGMALTRIGEADGQQRASRPA